MHLPNNNQMMKLKYFLLPAILLMALQSCVIMSPKKYKALLSERDSLSIRANSLEDTVAKLRADTMRLHRELREAQNSYATLNGNYNTLNDKYSALNNSYNTSSSRVNELSTSLKKREERLKEVED